MHLADLAAPRQGRLARARRTASPRLYVRGARVDWAGVDRPYGYRARRCRPIRSSAARSGSHRRRPGAHAASPRCRAARMRCWARGLRQRCRFSRRCSAPERPAYLGRAPHPGRRTGRRARVPGDGAGLRPRAARPARSRGRATSSSVSRWCCQRQDALCSCTSRPEPDGALPFSVHSRASDGSGDWQLHATGRLCRRPQPARAAVRSAAAPDRAGLGRSIAVRSVLREARWPWHPARRVLPQPGQARRRHREVLASLALPQACAADAVCWAHPGLLDGALQAVGLAFRSPRAARRLYLLTEIDRVELAGPLAGAVAMPCTAATMRTNSNPLNGAPTSRCAPNDGAVLGMIHGVDAATCIARCPVSRGGGCVRHGFVLPGRLGAGAGVAACIHYAAGAGAVHAARREPVRHRSRSSTACRIYDHLLPRARPLSAEHVAVALRRLGFDADAWPRVLAGRGGGNAAHRATARAPVRAADARCSPRTACCDPR